MRPAFAFSMLLALVLTACAMPQRAGIPTQWLPSPNFDERRPNFVILHHTGDGSAADALRTLTDARREVSAHYVVARDGTIYQLVDERARAWHAGESKWGGHTDLNSASIGVELDNDGDEPFPDAQISALLALLEDLQKRYRIPAANFLGHADVAPKRKADPSRHFPWRTLAEHGFGLWCDPPWPQPSNPFDANLALEALGYDVSDPQAAIQAFKLHFVQDESQPVLDEAEQGLLQCLLSKKLPPETLGSRGGQ